MLELCMVCRQMVIHQSSSSVSTVANDDLVIINITVMCRSEPEQVTAIHNDNAGAGCIVSTVIHNRCMTD